VVTVYSKKIVYMLSVKVIRCTKRWDPRSSHSTGQLVFNISRHMVWCTSLGPEMTSESDLDESNTADIDIVVVKSGKR
jgi:hypothetical protein